MKPGLEDWPDNFQGFQGSSYATEERNPVKEYLSKKKKEEKAKRKASLKVREEGCDD